MAAITSAPKLLRHLGSSLVLLLQTGRTRGRYEEVARREGTSGGYKAVGGGWGGRRVRRGDVLRSHCIHGIP